MMDAKAFANKLFDQTTNVVHRSTEQMIERLAAQRAECAELERLMAQQQEHLARIERRLSEVEERIK